ncbi:TonB-dependent receptor [Chitinophagaceae bacterium LB-8]|uniref:TonB-dependent receptor n=1 Tax=Paraflavisolibacter caeni TaxID=2982496 RepID=A0A9X2XV06_9BACT|nr:TonB-dependent receptor [Paraflavisolibacter caeni]MCU7548882.1 TonB-dependent receptor [Paraflavisolibacter caeni]
MSTIKRMAIAVFTILISYTSFTQNVYKGKIIDAVTREAIAGASVNYSNSKTGCSTNQSGAFSFTSPENKPEVQVSFIGYETQNVQLSAHEQVISLVPSQSLMQEVVVSANRESMQRSQAPIAIASINAKTLQDAKAISFDQVLNKVSGVYMVNLGNEQHQMSIRQPMTTKSLFLYLEDGIPVRTTGLFNHNALLEMNMANVKNIEVIKGPSSSLYGSEAIGGVVNFITLAPTATPVAKLSLQGNNFGYKRLDGQASFTSGKWGFVLSGYTAKKQNSFIEFSDFNKSTVSAKIDYHFTDRTTLSNSLTWMDYYSDMSGSIDSTMFANHSFKSQQTFTYRKVAALRYRSTLTHQWNNNSKTSASLIYRDNTIGQNPAYSIKDDYRKTSTGFTGKKDLAHGEINNSSFNSYALIAQHRQNLAWKNAVLIGGLSADLSPSTYLAEYIRIKKDTISRKYTGYEQKDSTLTDYKTNINNYAGFVNFEFSPVQKLRVVASVRYDLFQFHFDNHLKPSSFSGSPDTVNNFSAFSPKVGFTYNLSERSGFYANYSQGFVPPQVTEMYKGVKVPNLNPSTFYNYEIGGWMEVIKNKLSADFSAYLLNGTNEIISVRLDDGSTENRNTGKTSHKGIELGMNATPIKNVSIRFSGAYSEHRFTEFIEKGNNYNGNEMNGAPRWMHNAEVWYKPAFVKGLRMGIEWQKIGNYFMDPLNTTKYEGYDVFHVRAGYQFKGVEVWVNMMNATDRYYAYNASRSTTSYSYTPAEPRHFNVGVSYDFGKLFY